MLRLSDEVPALDSLGVLGDRWFVLALVLALAAATTLGQIHSRSLNP